MLDLNRLSRLATFVFDLLAGLVLGSLAVFVPLNQLHWLSFSLVCCLGFPLVFYSLGLLLPKDHSSLVQWVLSSVFVSSDFFRLIRLHLLQLRCHLP
jgi:hypothetical protein